MLTAMKALVLLCVVPSVVGIGVIAIALLCKGDSCGGWGFVAMIPWLISFIQLPLSIALFIMLKRRRTLNAVQSTLKYYALPMAGIATSLIYLTPWLIAILIVRPWQ